MKRVRAALNLEFIPVHLSLSDVFYSDNSTHLLESRTVEEDCELRGDCGIEAV